MYDDLNPGIYLIIAAHLSVTDKPHTYLYCIPYGMVIESRCILMNVHNYVHWLGVVDV